MALFPIFKSFFAFIPNFGQAVIWMLNCLSTDKKEITVLLKKTGYFCPNWWGRGYAEELFSHEKVMGAMFVFQKKWGFKPPSSRRQFVTTGETGGYGSPRSLIPRSGNLYLAYLHIFSYKNLETLTYPCSLLKSSSLTSESSWWRHQMETFSA